MAKVSLILGGARSGKSARGLALADAAPRTYLATAQALDDEMAQRIACHKAERTGWDLIEAPLEIAREIRGHRSGGTLVVDCLTLWLSNLMYHGRDVDAATADLVACLGDAPCRVVLVSNEIGLAPVPENALARRFRDAQGRLNQAVAQTADHVELVVAGLPTVLKGSP